MIHIKLKSKFILGLTLICLISTKFVSSQLGSLDSSGEIELEKDDENEDNTKFSYLQHQDDHGIYAYRSLMSLANVKQRPNMIDTDDELASEVSSNDRVNHNPKYEEELDPLKTSDYAEKEWQLMFRYYDFVQQNALSSILQQIGEKSKIFEDILTRLKPECRRDINHIRNSLKKHKLWALRMVDSNGKLPSGITYGRFSSPGDYEECLSVKVDELIYKSSDDNQPDKFKFHGKYCLLDFRLPLPERPHDKLLSIHDPVLDLGKTELGKQFPELKNYSGYASALYEVGYLHAFCLPSSCDVIDITKSLGVSLEGLHIIVNNTVDCEEKLEDPLPLRTSQKISIGFIGILFVNAALATIMHYYLSKVKEFTEESRQMARKDYSEHEQKFENNSDNLETSLSKFKQKVAIMLKRNRFYIDCFSVQTNFERLSKPDPRGLTFVHYTRIVAMALTVITHTGGLGTLQAITKPADASNSEQIFRDFIPQMLANAFTSIQIFFFMAGFMLVISTYPSLKREKGHLDFLEYAVKRAIRLMPGVTVTIALNFIWPLLVDGPMLTYFIRAIVIPCETTWWRTLAFLSNFDHVEKMCLRHSYFSASDYQLHIMAFPLLLLLYKQPTIALFLAGILTVSGFVAQVIMVLTKILMPFMMVDYIDKEAFFNVVHYIHHPVWNHMAAFFYGFIIGYLVVKQIRFNLSETTIKRIWIILMPLGIASIFAPYFWNHYKRPIQKWQMVIYVIVDRFVLLTTCAWLSYASMVLGRKPVAKKSHNPKPNLNLPDIVVPDQEKAKSTGDKDNFLVPSSDSKSLTKTGSLSSIPRQRSSPNIQNLNRSDTGANLTLKMRPANSSANLTCPNDDKKRPICTTNQPIRRPPISNVNTLCLILSRLTFQLYLFNMVVLWVDVNHSKYYWYFSYYFIITKAFAIYIASAILAMIFFVTLESPCLTLYIVWVKSRAKKRNEIKEKREAKLTKYMEATDNGNKKPESYNKELDEQKSGNSNLGASFDGLCMRTSPNCGATRPGSASPETTFSYIDISPSFKNINQTESDIQTKM